MADTNLGVTPQLTFTEDEHASLIAFLNLLNKAKFDLSIRESHDLARNHVKVVNLAKKIENHVMEIKRVIQKVES